MQSRSPLLKALCIYSIVQNALNSSRFYINIRRNRPHEISALNSTNTEDPYRNQYLFMTPIKIQDPYRRSSPSSISQKTINHSRHIRLLPNPLNRAIPKMGISPTLYTFAATLQIPLGRFDCRATLQEAGQKRASGIFPSRIIYATRARVRRWNRFVVPRRNSISSFAEKEKNGRAGSSTAGRKAES